MVMKAVVENLDSIPAELHDEYVEKDGKFYLSLDDTVKVHTAVIPLTNSLATLKREKGELRTKLTEAEAQIAAFPEDFDKEQYEEAKEAFEALKKDPAYKGGPKNDADLQRMREQYESRIRNLEAAHSTKVVELEGKIEGKDAKIRGDHANRELASALNEAGVDKKYMKATQALLRTAVKVADEEGQDLRAYVETDMGEVPLSEYVQNWARSDEGKPFVVPPTGGGAQTPNGRAFANNPFSYEHWNVTEQGALYREKGADHANRLAKAAGTVVGGPRPAPRSRADA